MTLSLRLDCTFGATCIMFLRRHACVLTALIFRCGGSGMDGLDMPGCVTSPPMGSMVEMTPSDKNLSEVPAALALDSLEVRKHWSRRQSQWLITGKGVSGVNPQRKDWFGFGQCDQRKGWTLKSQMFVGVYGGVACRIQYVVRFLELSGLRSQPRGSSTQEVPLCIQSSHLRQGINF